MTSSTRIARRQQSCIVADCNPLQHVCGANRLNQPGRGIRCHRKNFAPLMLTTRTCMPQYDSASAKHSWPWLRGCAFRRSAGIAVSPCRPSASLAHRLRVVRPCPAAVRILSQRRRCASPARLRRAFSCRLSLRLPLVHGELLLGPRHHDALRRHARRCARSAAHRLQSGSRPLLRHCSACAWCWSGRRTGRRGCPGWPHRSSGSRWNWQRPASPVFPGISWATRRSITRL